MAKGKGSGSGDGGRQIDDLHQDRTDAVVGEELEEDEFAESDDAEASAEIEGFDDDDAIDVEGAEDIDAVVELTSKEQSARSLEIRRAIERRMEKRQLKEDLDYLDLDD